jgi:hypothetical protein
MLMAQNVTINIVPTTTKSLDSISLLDRSKYFTICDNGVGFEQRLQNQSLLSKYLIDYDIKFGRRLSLVKTLTAYYKNVVPDASRPGFANISYLRQNARPPEQYNPPSSWMSAIFPDNLGTLCHDDHNSYPAFMPKEVYPGTTDSLPVNKIAAAELAVNLLKYNFTNWSRPISFEPINEPTWQLLDSTKMLSNLADFHLKMWEKAKTENLNTLIGGPCSSVSYYYYRKYQYWKSFAKFIDETQGQLDFYSFHVYDFLRWDNIANKVVGQIGSGLPLEGVLDLLSNYGKVIYNKNFKFLSTEHGGYFAYEDQKKQMSSYYLGNGNGFDYDMKVKSLFDYCMVSSAIANTMVFMNHPGMVIKAVPFILAESFDWNPKYYSSMLVAKNYTDKTNWYESSLVHFYKFFQGVQGRYVYSSLGSPDVQKHVFVDNNKLIIVLNNLSDSTINVNLNYPTADIDSTIIRSFSRNSDATPSFEQNKSLTSITNTTLKGREAKVLLVHYRDNINETKRVNESYYYSSLFAKQFSSSQNFTVNVPTPVNIEYAYLRIGIGRDRGTDRRIQVNFNGTDLEVPLEKCADRLEYTDGYGSTKIIPVDKELIKSSNSIQVSFSDGKGGGVGSVTLCVATTQNPALDTKTVLQPKPAISFFSDKVSGKIRISYSHENPALTKLTLFNTSGKLLRTLCNDYLLPAEYTYELDADNLSDEVYILQLIQNNDSFSYKFSL